MVVLYTYIYIYIQTLLCGGGGTYIYIATSPCGGGEDAGPIYIYIWRGKKGGKRELQGGVVVLKRTVISWCPQASTYNHMCDIHSTDPPQAWFRFLQTTCNSWNIHIHHRSIMSDLLR